MLLAARDIIGGANWVQSQDGNADVAAATEKEKKKFAGSELQGKKLGIIGLGAIGVKVANTAIHLGMDVYGYDPYTVSYTHLRTEHRKPDRDDPLRGNAAALLTGSGCCRRRD